MPCRHLPFGRWPRFRWLRGRESNPHGRRLTADRSTFELPRSARPPSSWRRAPSFASRRVVARLTLINLVLSEIRGVAGTCTHLRPRTVARPGFEPGSTGSEPAIVPLDHRAIRNTLVPGVARSARCAVRLVDPKGLEPSRRRVRAAASASRGSGSVLRDFAVCFPCRVVYICLNVDLLHLFHPFVSAFIFNLFDLNIHHSRTPSGRCPRVCASRPRRPSEELIASLRERPADRLRPASRIVARALRRSTVASRWSVSRDPENEKADSAFGAEPAFFRDRWTDGGSSPHGPAPLNCRGFCPATRR